MRPLLALLVLSLLPAWAVAQTPEPLTLRPDWEVGQTARYSFVTTRDTKTTMSAQGRTESADTSMRTEGELTWRVEGVKPGGGYICTMTLDWMAVALTGPAGEKRSIDSRRGSGDPPPLYQLVKAMSGVPLRVTVNGDGSIASISGREAMTARVEDPALIPEELDFMESASDLVTLPHAPAEITTGGSWRSRFRWTHDLGHLDYQTTWRPTGIEEIDGIPIAGVTAEASVKLDVDRSEIPPNVPMDIRLTGGQFESQVLYDLTRDEAVARNTTESRTIDFTIRLPQGTVTRRVVETIRSQTQRIGEE